MIQQESSGEGPSAAKTEAFLSRNKIIVSLYPIISITCEFFPEFHTLSLFW